MTEDEEQNIKERIYEMIDNNVQPLGENQMFNNFEIYEEENTIASPEGSAILRRIVNNF